MRVLVTGATGKIGRRIVRRLLSRGIATFAVRALVRGEEAEQALRQHLGSLANCLEVCHGDIRNKDTLDYAFRGVDAVVIATGPSARVDIASLLGESAWGVVSLGFSSAKPTLWFEDRVGPRQIDWEGQRTQIDAAKAAGARHIVLLSSIGGTKLDHFLNEKMSDIAVWKRRAEHYLIASGVPYTILRVGGLYASTMAQLQPPEEAPPRGRLCVGVDDEASEGQWEHGIMPPSELAALCAQCLEEPSAIGRSFDLWCDTTVEASEREECDLAVLLAALKGRNCRYEDPPQSPRWPRPKRPGSSSGGFFNIMSAPTCDGKQPLPCGADDVVGECACVKDGRTRFLERRDVQDAEAPGMQVVDEKSFFDERSFRSVSRKNLPKKKEGFMTEEHIHTLLPD